VSNRPAGSGVTETLDLSAVLRQHDRWLRTVVYSRVGSREGVDDVMQEVALAAVRQAATLPDASRMAPWLYRVAVRQSLLYRRKAGRRRKLANGYVQQLPPAEHDTSCVDPLDWLLARERSQLVRVALERLANRDREILMLKYAEQWSYQQIAEHLGATQSAVEARLHRARARLRTELAAVEGSDTTDEVAR
jgi:RNA polymerase sigma factor (sigma-70 family)